MPATVTASEALRLLLEKGDSVRALDVRSEGEFAEGAIPGFCNLPILTNPERHEVGLSYKRQGQAAAVELGQKLVAPQREARIERWRERLAGSEIPLVACWRGGMRSRIAAEWIEGSGQMALQVEGGYKRMRRELLRALEELPPLFVVAGPTGSGKSRLLRECGRPHLDLEALARHRGSAFGGLLGQPQPSQASFENLVAFSVRQRSPRLVEDESAMIGQLCVPPALRERIAAGRVIRIRMGLEERVSLLLQEYVSEPMAEGASGSALREHYLRALAKIDRRLGGLAAAELRAKLNGAFASTDPEAHRDWIRDLLTLYYDKAYEYSFSKFPRESAFEGDWHACKQWIQEQFA